MPVWNPWHGCERISPGCANCYVYRMDEKYDRDAADVRRTGNFDLPLKRDRRGSWKLPDGQTIYTCFTSDFFLPAADQWRGEAWDMIAARPNATFIIVTKRIDRFRVCLPENWGDGWENVVLCATCEDQIRADERLPIFLSLPIRHRLIICEPMLTPIDLSPYLDSRVEGVLAGGESGPKARLCRFGWITALREQCAAAGVPFSFKQTGARFEKDGRIYKIPRGRQHEQARRAMVDFP